MSLQVKGVSIVYYEHLAFLTFLIQSCIWLHIHALVFFQWLFDHMEILIFSVSKNRHYDSITPSMQLLIVISALSELSLCKLAGFLWPSLFKLQADMEFNGSPKTYQVRWLSEGCEKGGGSAESSQRVRRIRGV